jgi:hypothetical protein
MCLFIFFYSYTIKRPRVAERWKSALFFLTWGGVGVVWYHIIMEIGPWTIVCNVFGRCHALGHLYFSKKSLDIVACSMVCINNPTQISIRFQWVSKVVTRCPTTISSMVLYFANFVLFLNIYSALHIEITKRKLKACPLWTVGRYLTPELIT